MNTCRLDNFRLKRPVSQVMDDVHMFAFFCRTDISKLKAQTFILIVFSSLV